MRRQSHLRGVKSHMVRPVMNQGYKWRRKPWKRTKQAESVAADLKPPHRWLPMWQ